jgi:hypothetical protein
MSSSAVYLTVGCTSPLVECTTCHTTAPEYMDMTMRPVNLSRSALMIILQVPLHSVKAIVCWLIARIIQTQEIFAHRLTQFYKSTSPLISYYAAAASTSSQSGSRFLHPHQHPHQLFFGGPPQKLQLTTLYGKTSDEIWPQLVRIVNGAFPNLRERVERRMRHSLSEAVVADVEAVARRGN